MGMGNIERRVLDFIIHVMRAYRYALLKVDRAQADAKTDEIISHVRRLAALRRARLIAAQ
jgi:hypothetical protein